MKNKAVVVVVILGSLIISIFAGCRQSPLKYILPTIDSVNNDKSRMGLNGKVKTLDIYYYRPENTSSFFSTKFKKGEKWEEDGIHHYHFHFNIDGNLAQCNEYDKQENIIRKTDYTYETWGHTSTLSFPKTNSTIVSKYNTDGKLLEIVYSDSHGEINTYDDRGNLIRTKQIDGTIDKPAMTEYDYNEHDLLVEKREY